MTVQARKLTLISCVASLLMQVIPACGGPDGVGGQEVAQGMETDHFVPSRPENVSWGWYPLDKEPVLTVQSGETVRIETLTHAGTTQSEEPVAYLAELGVPHDEILQDVIDYWASREGREREGRSGHVIIGPI